MALWDKMFGKKDEDPRHLKPIVQKSPMPVTPPPPTPPPPPPERETKSRKKEATPTRSGKPSDADAFLKRGQARQANGDHDGAIADFTKAIELNPALSQAYASRGVSRDAKGDQNGAKADYSKMLEIEITTEISRQIKENPEVEL